jgi:Fe-S oxidoreductase
MLYPSLKDYLYEEKDRFLKNCSGCSRCIEVCPNVEAFNLNSEQIKSLPQKLLDTLAGGELSDSVFQWVFGCNHCGCCIPECFQDLNPLILNKVLRCEFLRQEHKKIVMMRDYLCAPNAGFKKTFDIMQQLFLKPTDIRWITGIVENPDPVDIAVFIGCTGLIRPDISLALIDIMDMLGVKYVALGGAQFCCGAPFQMFGEVDQFEIQLRNLVSNLMAFNPEQVIYVCSECFYNVTHMASKIMDFNFKQSSALKFIADNIEQLSFEKSQPVKVTFHDPCSLGRLCGDFESPRKILNQIPGVEFIEMQHIKEESPCCGGFSETLFPGKNEPLRQMRLKDFQQSGAAKLVTACVGCELSYKRWRPNDDMGAINIFTFLLKSLGIHRQDPLGPFYQAQDVEGVLEKYKDNIAAGAYTEDEYRATVSRFLGIKQKDK